MKISGADELIGALKSRTSLDDVRKTVKLNGSEMQKRTQGAAAVDTGFMRRSIALDNQDMGFTATVKPSAEYASYVEYGTRFQSPQPFVKPSFLTQSNKFINDMRKLMR